MGDSARESLANTRAAERGMVRWLVPWLVSAVSLAVTVGLLGVTGTFLADPYPRFEISDTATIQSIIDANVAALSAALGILVALVLLSMQFTAQRYSFDVVRIFIGSWVNAMLIGFFIVTISFNLWLGTFLTDDDLPVAAAILSLAMTTACFAVLPPYIVFLSDVLRPETILNYLQRELLDAVDTSKRPGNVARRKAAAYDRIDQIIHIALTAVSLADSTVARHSIWVLYVATSRYVERKAKLPAEWFAVWEDESDPSDELIVHEIEKTRTWLEWRMLDEVEDVFYATLNRMHDVNNQIARAVRLLGDKAVECEDLGLLRVVTTFLNTFLREAINQGDARAGYHVLYQYRRLAETALARHPEVVIEIASRLRYYGDAAAGGPLLWMSAAAVHDLRILAEQCHDRGADRGITAAIVADLLDAVERAKAKQSPALFQLYKTLAALGSFLLVRGEPELARQLRGRLDDIPGAILEQVGRELTACEDPIFWEVTDRVVNFDFLQTDVRAGLPTFLEHVEAWPGVATTSLRS